MSVTTYPATGDTYINGLLMGTKWASSTLTYSFPTSSNQYEASYGSREPSRGFEALNETQKAAALSAMAMYAAVADLTFTPATSPNTAVIRMAESDVPSTAWAYYPTTRFEGGDIWFNNSKNWYDSPLTGNYANLTFFHELGHALGLKHPHEVSGSFNALPADRDSLEYTVMSYRSYVGASTSTGYTNETWGYPQTLMMYDIAAVQTMYGANYDTNNANTSYVWNPDTGELTINGDGRGAPGANRIFETVWDGGGTDTYNFSLYSATTSLKIDLRPGQWTTTAPSQLAYLGGGKYAVGNIANALLYGTNTASLIENAIGGDGADTITGNQVNNHLDGRGGNDTAVFSGKFSNYSFAETNGTWTVASSSDGTDTLVSIEYAQFTDGTYDLRSGTPTLVSPGTPTDTDPPLSTPGEVIIGTSKNNNLTGTGGDDTINGLGGNDKMRGDGGNDRLDGGAGTDTAIYSGGSTDYSVVRTSTGWTVTDNRSGSPDGSDTLLNVERLQFSNTTLLLSSSSPTASAPAAIRSSSLEIPDDMPVPVGYVDTFDFSQFRGTPEAHGGHDLPSVIAAALQGDIPGDLLTAVMQQTPGLELAAGNADHHSAFWLIT